MTSDIGILNASTETWIGTLEAGFTDRAIKYIHLDPTANYLYILDASNKELRRVDVENGEIVGPIPLADGGFGQLAAVDEVRARFYLATTKGLAAFDGNTLEQLYTVEGLGDHVGPMRYNPAADAFYILDSTSKETGRAIHILDGASGQITGAINYSVPQGGRSRWLHFDPADQTFIIGLDRVVLLLDMNGNEVGAFSLSGKQALEDQLYDPATKRLFVLSMQAPQNGQITAIGGQMDVYDLSGSLLSSFSVGRKPHHMELNPTNSHIYIPNGDASVVWSIDTHAPTQANPLRLGDSVEQIVPSGDGSAVYLASRLGGSYIERYDLNSGSFESFTAGTWPIPLRRDSSGEHLFSLNAWDSTLSVYSMTPQQTLLATIPLGLPAGSTDRLPDLTIDSTHQLAYAAYPEFGMVAVVNWDIMQPVVTLAIPNAETGDTGGGPGQLQVAVNENENRVFVYESRARRLFIYDAANNYASLGEVDLREQSRVIGQADADLFFFDSQTNRLFLGALELDGATAQPTGRSLPAGNQIFGMDSNANLYWVVDEASNALLAMDRDTLAVRHSQPMPESAAALPTLAYNPIRNQVYVGYLTSAQVYIFTIGQIP
jgi:DNA-binding beta-propeller fold protein YncE